jgi:hypothetical protein
MAQRSPCARCLRQAARLVAGSAAVLRAAANAKPIPSVPGRVLHVRASEREEVAAGLRRAAGK